MDAKLIYSPRYDMAPPGAGLFHPFDGRKYSKAWAELKSTCDVDLDTVWKEPSRAIDDDILTTIHSTEYLNSLNQSSVVSQIIEIPLAKYLPNSLLQRHLITPMKVASEGTRLATKIALDGFIVMNVGGGFHHAFSSHGEGFCVFADAAIAIMDARNNGLLSDNDKVLMIDLDAHRGNGFESIFKNDTSVQSFDMYNFQMYPGMHEGDPDEYPFMLPLKNRTTDDTYLKILKEELPKFMSANEKPKLVFYNAGSDILAGDSLGNLNVSYDGVVERDRYITNMLKKMGIPTVIVTSGGYTKESYKLVSSLAKMVITGRGL